MKLAGKSVKANRAEGVNLSGVRYDRDCKQIALRRIPRPDKILGAEGVSIAG